MKGCVVKITELAAVKNFITAKGSKVVTGLASDGSILWKRITKTTGDKFVHTITKDLFNNVTIETRIYNRGGKLQELKTGLVGHFPEGGRKLIKENYYVNYNRFSDKTMIHNPHMLKGSRSLTTNPNGIITQAEFVSHGSPNYYSGVATPSSSKYNTLSFGDGSDGTTKIGNSLAGKYLQEINQEYVNGILFRSSGLDGRYINNASFDFNNCRVPDKLS